MKNLFTLVAVLIITQCTVIAQQSMTLYNFQEVQQASYQNPAFDTQTKLTTGIPFLSSIYLKASNTIFQPAVLFSNNEGQVSFNKEEYLNSLRDQNYMGVNVSVDLISFSQKIGNNKFSLAIRERMSTRISLPKDFLAFPFTGNANFEELDQGILDFSGLKFDMLHYREIALGFQRNLTDKISIGATAKYLYGYENIDFEKSEIIWKTNEQSWDWEILGQIEVNTSGIIEDTTSNDPSSFKDYVFKRKNRGIGLDLGITYDVSDRLQLSASMIDLGFIKWKNNVETTVTNDAQFIYSGLNISENVVLAGGNMADSIDVAVEQLEEDFKDAFSYSTNNDSYKTSLLTQVNIGARLKLKESERFSNSLGVLIHNEFYKGKINTSYGLSFQQNVAKHLNTVLSYSVMDGDFKNLGLGLVLTFSKFQFHVAADNLMALNLTKIKFGDEEAGIPVPTYSKNANILFGFNLVFPDKIGKKKAKKSE